MRVSVVYVEQTKTVQDQNVGNPALRTTISVYFIFYVLCLYFEVSLLELTISKINSFAIVSVKL